MTRLQIQNLVLSWLDDDSGGYFAPATVQTWINLAHRQVQMHLLQAGENYYEIVVETQTVASQADYVLPADNMVVHRIELIESGTGVNEVRRPLGFLTTNQQDLVCHSLGTPSNYILKKDRFTLFPTPAQVWTLRLYYSPLVADLSGDTDVPDCPEQYMEYIALLAAFNGYIRDDMVPQNLQAKKMEFEMLLKQMAEDRNQDQSRQVVQVVDYDSDGGFY
jgi:hypothetical protein